MRPWKIFSLLIFTFFSAAIFAQTAKLQVIHNSSDPAAEEVDVYLNGTLLLDDFTFRTATPYVDAPAGTPINIGVAPGTSTSASDTLKNFTVTLAENVTYIAVANGVLNPAQFSSNPDSRETGFTLFIKDNARTVSTDTSEVQLVAVHGSTDAPSVDIIARNVGTLVNDAAYSDITSYIEITIPPAEYILDVTPANNNDVIVGSFGVDFSGLAGETAVVFASGFLDPSQNQNGPAFGLFAALNNGTVAELPLLTTARLQVIHNAADPAAEEVDVYLNGTLLLDDFAFRSATPFIDAPANELLNIGIAPGTSTLAADTLKNFQVTLMGGEKYLAVANGVLNPNNFVSNPNSQSIAFTLFLTSGVREEAENPGLVDLLVVHGASDAPAVDVIARGVTTLVDGFTYSDIPGYLSVPASNYILDIAADASNAIVASFGADLSALAGGSAVVLASGFLNPSQNQNGEPFTLLVAFADGNTAELGAVTSLSNDDKAGIITEYSLDQNHPNPFNPATSISFSLAGAEFVTLKVFNIIGEEVSTLVNGQLEAGRYSFSFDASTLSSGVYLYRISAGDFTSVKKMILSK